MSRRNDAEAAALIEDLTFLAEVKVGLTEAARRTDVASAEALDRWLRTHDQVDLLHQLLANEPRMRKVAC